MICSCSSGSVRLVEALAGVADSIWIEFRVGYRTGASAVVVSAAAADYG